VCVNADDLTVAFNFYKHKTTADIKKTNLIYFSTKNYNVENLGRY
jgi:hypothetical protein